MLYNYYRLLTVPVNNYDQYAIKLLFQGQAYFLGIPNYDTCAYAF